MNRIHAFLFIIVFLINICESYAYVLPLNYNSNKCLRRKIQRIKFTKNDNEDTSNISQKLIAGISFAGFVETSYLTWTKLTNSLDSFCISPETCNTVLSTPYSSIPIVNIPLTLLGALSYGIVLMLSVTSFNSEDDIGKSIILFLSMAMATFSGYLMYVLHAVLSLDCTYCHVSALLSFILATLSWNGNMIGNKTKATVLSVGSIATTSLFSALLLYVTGAVTNSNVVAEASTAPAAQIFGVNGIKDDFSKNTPPKIKKDSSDKAIEIARELQKMDAKMYGAYWCSHCNNQKQILGIQAIELIPYIECDKVGYNSEYPLCRSKEVCN